MTEHDGRGAAQAHPVGRLHHLQPLAAVDLVGTEAGAHLVIQYLRRGARQRRESRRPQPLEVVDEVDPEGLGTLPHLQR